MCVCVFLLVYDLVIEQNEGQNYRRGHRKESSYFGQLGLLARGQRAKGCGWAGGGVGSAEGAISSCPAPVPSKCAGCWVTAVYLEIIGL